jgi:membrane-bound serine protease (ClpP class)
MRLLFMLSCLVALLWPATARAESYVHIRIEGVVNPVKARYVARSLKAAERAHAEFVVVSIDSPGGLVTSMEEITGAFTNSHIPIIGFVEPTSAQATSAAAFILLSTDIAAMAPHTRVGAAHPVGTGENLTGAMNDKATNSLVSLAKTLAARRGRPESFAESIVRDSKSYTAEEAKELGAVEVLAENRDDLLQKIDGRKLTLGKTEVVLAARGANAIEIESTWTERLLDVIANPTIASMLLSLGMLGILYELSSPGIGMGGVVGVTSLLLGLAALSVLPLELGGLLLLLVGFVAIAVELKAQTHGMLAAGGVAALLLGALLLVSPGSYYGAAQLVDFRIFGPFVVVATLGFLLLARVALRSQKKRFQTGVESLLGRHGSAKSAFDAVDGRYEGSVFVDGARWEAVSKEPIGMGEGVKVTAVLKAPTRLEVQRSEKGAA